MKKDTTLMLLLISIILISSTSAIDFPSRFPYANLDSILQWGTYKPQCYHTIASKNDNGNRISLGLEVAYDLSTPDVNNLKFWFRDFQDVPDDTTYLAYSAHNGYYYAQQELNDSNFRTLNTFLKNNVTNVYQNWQSLTQIIEYPESGDDVTVFVYLTLESADNNANNYIKFNPDTGMIQIYQPGNLVPQNIKAFTYVNGDPS